MIRRTAFGGLVVLLAVTAAGTASAEPTGLPHPKPSSRFTRYNPDRLPPIVNLPQSLKQDKVVSALVQLDGKPVAVQQVARSGLGRADALRSVRAQQDAVAPALAAAGATTYGHLTTVLNAVQVRVKVSDLKKVAAVPGVEKVQVSTIVHRENSASNAYTGVDQTWQDLKLTGKGQTIGIIDSGIDYTHADFGGPGTVAAFDANDSTVVEPGTFPTAKVTGGYDFVGDDYDAAADDEHAAQLVPHPDADPLDCGHGAVGHGSHVAGTVAGSGVTTAGHTYTGPYNRATTSKAFDVEPGVAPQAKLRAYRVFGCEGSVTDDIIVAAIDRATSDGVDVINMSLGSSMGTADNMDSVAITNATAAGVLVVASAGNSGAGAYLVGAPATSNAALAVAAADTEYRSYPGATISGAASGKGILANDARLTHAVTAPLVDVGLGCVQSDYAAVAGKIALTTRGGGCPRIDRAIFGQTAGAVGVIMINNEATLPPFEGPIPGVTIPFVGVPSGTGPALLAANGKTVTLTGGAAIANPTYGQIADFSSNGPRFGDSTQKPDVTAPGVSIPSVAVGTGTGNQRLSGTSMASPHTAGVAALVRQAHPTWNARQVKAVVMSTASPARVRGYDSQAAGTGMVQPRRATVAKTYSWTSSGLNTLRFGLNQLSGRHVETQAFKISNRSTQSVRYHVSSALSTSRRGAEVQISPRTLTVKAGTTRSVSVTLRLSTADVQKLPGAAASDGGVLSSIHGRIVATPTKVKAAAPVLQTTFMFVPVPLSDVRAPASVTLPAGSSKASIRLTNAGVHTGTSQVYSWLLADVAGDGSTQDVADLTNLGVQSLPGTVVGAAASDRLLVFAASEATGTSSQSSREVDVSIDTNGDGEADYTVFTADAGLVLAGELDGTLGSFVVDNATGAITAAYSASGSANGSTVEFPVLASDLGLTSASAPVTVAAAGYSVLVDTPGDGMTGTATFSPYRLAASSGNAVTLAPGRSASVAVTVDRSQLGSQTHAGWLVVTPDDRAGYAEGNRVALKVAASPAVKVGSR